MLNGVLEENVTPAPVPRTRRLITKQSKNGCYTCRARRKKCDETRPLCSRCLTSGFACQGYRHDHEQPERAWSETSMDVVELMPAKFISSLPEHALASPIESQHCLLGLEILSAQGDPGASSISSPIWTNLYPQLCQLSPCLHAAIASLGLTQIVIPNHGEKVLSLQLQYAKAISALRTELETPRNGPIPLFLACVALAAVEVYQRRLINALMHARGAFKIIHLMLSARQASSGLHKAENEPPHHADWFSHCHELYSVAKAIDMQTASFALSQGPDLPASPLTAPHSLDTASSLDCSISAIQSEVLSLLHSCYRFAAENSSYKYRLPHLIPTTIIDDQSKLISLLNQYLYRLEQFYNLINSPHHNIPLTSPSPSSSGPTSLQTLEIQILATKSYLSTLLSPSELAYDSHMSSFQRIIHLASDILQSRPSNPTPTPKPPSTPPSLSPSKSRFTILSPTSQPLYLTATKCRHPTIRRGAISLLRLTGLSGPWEGEVHARVASRIMTLEEDGDESDNTFDDGGIMPEKRRICGCGIHEVEDGNNRSTGRIVEVTFSRCRDLNRMLEDGDWEDGRHWEIWSEQLSVAPR